jgi:hypothetical protein
LVRQHESAGAMDVVTFPRSLWENQQFRASSVCNNKDFDGRVRQRLARYFAFGFSDLPN